MRPYSGRELEKPGGEVRSTGGFAGKEAPSAFVRQLAARSINIFSPATSYANIHFVRR